MPVESIEYHRGYMAAERKWKVRVRRLNGKCIPTEEFTSSELPTKEYLIIDHSSVNLLARNILQVINKQNEELSYAEIYQALVLVMTWISKNLNNSLERESIGYSQRGALNEQAKRLL